MWTWAQRTGALYDNDNTLVANGYSGFGPDKNCPESQDKKNKGPLPQGLYVVDRPVNSESHGPFALPLNPDPANEMFGRGAFLIHGDSVSHPGAASEGCIILSRAVREQIWLSKDHYLKVVKEV